MANRRRTAEERRRVVELYAQREDGLTRPEFCRRHGITTSTLDYWRRRENRTDLGALLPVKLVDDSAGRAGTGFVLRLANGRRIEAGWQFGADDLVRLIRVAESA